MEKVDLCIIGGSAAGLSAAARAAESFRVDLFVLNPALSFPGLETAPDRNGQGIPKTLFAYRRTAALHQPGYVPDVSRQGPGTGILGLIGIVDQLYQRWIQSEDLAGQVQPGFRKSG